jgi:hypothetical protein
MSVKIRDDVVPISIISVVLSVGLFTFTKMPPRGTADSIVAWLLLFVAFLCSVLHFPGTCNQYRLVYREPGRRYPYRVSPFTSILYRGFFTNRFG